VSSEKLIKSIDADPIARSLLKHYASAHPKPGRKGRETPINKEVDGASHLGLGISLNNVFLHRSILSMKVGYPTNSVGYLYRDMQRREAWLPLPALEGYVLRKQGPFEEGISSQDGIIFGFTGNWLGGLPSPALDAGTEEYLIYRNKIVGGEPRSEFFTAMHSLFGYDMRETLSALVSPKGVGSGTTSQVAEQCLGEMLAGSKAAERQYRLRKTRISETLDTGHILVYGVDLDPEIEAEMGGKFDFSQVLGPSRSVGSLVDGWVGAFESTERRTRCYSPADLFRPNKTTITGAKSKGRLLFIARYDNAQEGSGECDITDYVESLRREGF
jgi:hypothetical protein